MPAARRWSRVRFPRDWLQWAAPFADAPINALLISCAGIRVAPVLAAIEERVGVPVVTSNQGALWNCLRLLGIAERPRGFGAVLAGRYG